MPPYQHRTYDYQHYRDPYVIPMADLLVAPARARAQAEREAGQISANMWGQVGNIAAGTVGDLLRYKAEAPQREMQALQVEGARTELTSRQRVERANQTIDAIMQKAVRPGPSGVATLDRDLIQREVVAAGLGTRWPDMAKSLDAADAATLNVLKLKNDLAESQREQLAALAYGVHAAGNTPDAFLLGISHALANKTLSRDEVDPYIDSVMEDPAQIAVLTRQLMGASLKYAQLLKKDAEGFSLSPGQTRFSPTGAPIASLPAKPDQSSFQSKEVLLDGRPTMVGFDPAANRYLKDGRDVTARVQPVPPQRAPQDPIAAELARLRLDEARRNAEKTKRLAEMPSEYRTPMERAILALPATRRGQVVDTAQRLWLEGNTTELKDVIRQAAIDSENVDTQRMIEGRRDARRALRDVRSMLQDLKASGVSTNILRGTAEEVARRLGTSTDPRLATLGTRITETLFEYRRALTGVQFSFKEAQQYERMFPSYKNTLPLNEAILDGLERGMRNRDEEFWTQKLGAQGARLVGAIGESSSPPTTPGAPTVPTAHANTPFRVGDIVIKDGKRIKVTKLLPDGKYEGEVVP